MRATVYRFGPFRNRAGIDGYRYTFEPGANKEEVGIMIGPAGMAIISPNGGGTAVLKIDGGWGGTREKLTAAEAITAAKAGTYGLEWEGIECRGSRSTSTRA